MSSLIRFSYKVGNSDPETKLQDLEIQRETAEREALRYRHALLAEKEKHKPPQPLSDNEFCQKLAELKRILKSFEKQECDIQSQIVAEAFCQDFGGYYEYELAKKIIRLKVLVSEYNVLQCELIQNACDVSNAPEQIDTCCRELMACAEGKDVSSDTYVVLNQCWPIKL